MARIRNRKEFLAALDLTVTCPHCLAKLTPAQQNRLDMAGTMLCPACNQTWVQPQTGGSTS